MDQTVHYKTSPVIVPITNHTLTYCPFNYSYLLYAQCYACRRLALMESSIIKSQVTLRSVLDGKRLVKERASVG